MVACSNVCCYVASLSGVPVVWMYHSVGSHSSLKHICIVFGVGNYGKYCYKRLHTIFFFFFLRKDTFLFHLGKHPRVELLSHNGMCLLNLIGSCQTFSGVAVPFFIPISNV